MRYTEDALQDAWVKLLEQGGPASVPSHKLWLKVTARNITLQHGAKAARRAEAEEQAAGVYGRACRWMDEWRVRNRAYQKQYRTPEERAAAWQRYVEKHPEVRERRRAAYLRMKAKETPEQREHRLQVMRNWRERKKANAS